jgi:hypothetical protein
MKHYKEVWNQTKYLLTLTFFIGMLAFLIWYSCSNKKYNFIAGNKNIVENFQQKPNWIDTIKCLGLNNNDINMFHSFLAGMVNGEDPKKTLNNVIQMLQDKGLDYSKIIGCMFEPNNTNTNVEEFQLNDPYNQSYQEL